MCRNLNLLTSILVILLPVHALAATVRYEFVGEVSSVSITLGAAFTPGDAISGYFEFDNTTSDLNPGNVIIGQYAAITGFSMTFGSYTATSTGGSVTVSDFPPGIQDSVKPSMLLGDGLSGAPANGLALVGASVDLRDPTGLLLSSDVLPGLTQLNAFPSGIARFDFQQGFLGGEVGGTINAVPLPAAVSLLGIGLAGLGLIRRRRGPANEATR